ncbi:unnamed protein product [Schistosoma margrebowiei]|uniref:Uncharacterized protein n=1 Tax=Schistosoma margrebowiei TaxID=48269 RepID=A0AA85AIU7_9TREM|nr:unnamed protein product [Schistosoma margrebowiei]
MLSNFRYRSRDAGTTIDISEKSQTTKQGSGTTNSPSGKLLIMLHFSGLSSCQMFHDIDISNMFETIK